jgi:rare lipoprotein A
MAVFMVFNADVDYVVERCMDHFKRLKGLRRHGQRVLATALAAAWLGLSGCATRSGDGAPAAPPANVGGVPDAVPRVEPIRQGGPNKPYQVMGRSYQPFTEDVPFSERGIASWYGTAFHGKRTANGEVYDMYAMTAAHPTMPLPSYARVRNPANGREVVVRVNDRGPFHPGRVIDLSYAAAMKLDVRGVSKVELQRITGDEIRRGVATVPARAEPAPSTPPPFPPPTDGALPSIPEAAAGPEEEPARAGFWVQLGAFSQADAARAFQQQVAADQAWVAATLGVFNERGLYRLQAGPYADRAQAQGAAQRLQAALQLTPVVLSRPALERMN